MMYDCFFDGVCPVCGGHAHGMPLRCACGWEQAPGRAEKLKQALDRIWGEAFTEDAQETPKDGSALP